jgi:hypothetical protein
VLRAEWQLVQNLAETLRQAGHIHLARLLASQPVPGQPILALAARYFFRRAVEEDRTLFQSLMWASWEQMADSQRRGFAYLQEAFVHHGVLLDARLDELQTFLVQIHAALLDIRQEQLRQGHCFRGLYDAVCDLQRRLDLLPQLLHQAPAPSIHDGRAVAA